MKKNRSFSLAFLLFVFPFAQESFAQTTLEGQSDSGGSIDGDDSGEISADRPDELVGTWKAVIAGDDADTTRILEFQADGRFFVSETTTSRESLKRQLITQLGADPRRIQFVADSLAASESRFHGALVADKHVFAIELAGAWGVEGTVIQAVVDSFSISFNGLQGNDIIEFYLEIVARVVPADFIELVQLFALLPALLQETYDALVNDREVFAIGLYSIENDNLVVFLDENPVRYARVPETQTPDFDGDGTVGFGDFLLFAAAFGQSQGDAGYDARYDLDEDGVIGFGDFLIFAGAFGTGTS